MRNSKTARLLLWLILIITLTPAILRFFTPAVPNWVIWIAFVYTAGCALLLLPENDKLEHFITHNRKYLTMLVIISLLLRSMIDAFPDWILWIAISVTFPFMLLAGSREDKETAQ